MKSIFASSQYQLIMKLEADVVKFVPRDRQYLLDHAIGAIFSRQCGQKFFLLKCQLNDMGIVFLGEFVRLTEHEVRQACKEKKIRCDVTEKLVKNIKLSLEEIGLEMGMETPLWEQGTSEWFRRVNGLPPLPPRKDS